METIDSIDELAGSAQPIPDIAIIRGCAAGGRKAAVKNRGETSRFLCRRDVLSARCTSRAVVFPALLRAAYYDADTGQLFDGVTDNSVKGRLHLAVLINLAVLI